VLEARNRVGGRVYDEDVGGICVGRGAQLINGSFNNPFAILCLQVRIKSC
jgi:monoamine oxidase